MIKLCNISFIVPLIKLCNISFIVPLNRPDMTTMVNGIYVLAQTLSLSKGVDNWLITGL